jgi:hypothetical protein
MLTSTPSIDFARAKKSASATSRIIYLIFIVRLEAVAGFPYWKGLFVVLLVFTAVVIAVRSRRTLTIDETQARQVLAHSVV